MLIKTSVFYILPDRGDVWHEFVCFVKNGDHNNAVKSLKIYIPGATPVSVVQLVVH